MFMQRALIGLENFYDNLTAEEIWNVIEEFKKLNNGEDGTLFEQASYLSENAPIKDNWKELFLENWNNSSLSKDFKIDTLIDNGETVGYIRMLTRILVARKIIQ